MRQNETVISVTFGQLVSASVINWDSRDIYCLTKTSQQVVDL
jgi:hypothetical protein